MSSVLSSPLRCDGLGNHRRGSVLLQFTLISPASRVRNYKLRGLPHSHFTRLQVISQTRRSYTSPVPQFSQLRIWTFILDHPLFFHLSTLLIYVRLPRRAHGRGVTTAWCEIGFDLSEKSGWDHAPPLSSLSVRSLLPRTFHMHFHSDLSLFSRTRQNGFCHIHLFSKEETNYKCAHEPLYLKCLFHTRRGNWWKASSTSKWFDGGPIERFRKFHPIAGRPALSSPILVTGSFELSSPVN